MSDPCLLASLPGGVNSASISAMTEPEPPSSRDGSAGGGGEELIVRSKLELGRYVYYCFVRKSIEQETSMEWCILELRSRTDRPRKNQLRAAEGALGAQRAQLFFVLCSRLNRKVTRMEQFRQEHHIYDGCLLLSKKFVDICFSFKKYSKLTISCF